ncbi:glycosyltransferase [Duganella sp. FT94W]|uniref:Glycosyltransferase n=1 Tax=Duganella lactea TaxID=2692173 RepID=A0ABW9V933_9BURK|nr:glycosyltransferase [Duganella lactea]
MVIVNWNSGKQLKDCVDSINKYGAPFVEKIVVVDNGSTDGSAESVEFLSDVVLVRANANIGFGSASNQGAKEANTEYLLFLNPDAYLYQQSLPNVMQFMRDDANRQTGICGIQLVDEQGHVARSCARFPSAKEFIAHATGLSHLLGTKKVSMADWDHGSTREVDHVIGAFFLVRRSVFDAVGGFDERFFLYLEDLDFSRQAKYLGWNSTYFADAQAFHAGGGTSRQVKAKRLFYSLRSRIIYGFKHFDRSSAMLLAITTLCVEPFARLALALATCSVSSLIETLKGYSYLWRWLPQYVFFGKTR